MQSKFNIQQIDQEIQTEKMYYMGSKTKINSK